MVKRPVYLGVDIGGTNTKLAVLDRGRLAARAVMATRPEEGPDALFRRVAERVPALVRSTARLAGTGVGCAGLIDPARGKLLASPNLAGWAGARIAAIAKRHLKVPVLLDNDANAAGYGEYRRGSGRGSKMFVCITLGTGVGGALVWNGAVLRGSRSYAGEVGHMTIDEFGPLCKCGNRGCLEALVGSGALVARAKRLLRTRRSRHLTGRRRAGRPEITPRDLADAARKGDRVARQVFDEAAFHLGTAIASLVNIFNPDVVALGGGVSGGFGLMKRRVREVVDRRAFRDSAAAVRIVKARLGNDAATIGAALMAAERAAERTAARRRPR